MNKVVLVTGGSSGIGFAAAEALAKRGCTVYTLSRHTFHHSAIISLSADVTDEKAVQQAVSRVTDEAGRIDILVNCAGFGISGAAEFTELTEAKAQMDVNFFGTVNTAKAVLPILRAQGSGRIVNISSVASPVPIPFQAYYSATKAAIDAWSQALANEVRPFGISVCAVRPGDIATGFTDARRKSTAGDDVYGGRIARSVQRMEQDERNGMDPRLAGEYIARTALRRRVRPLQTIGFSYKLVCFAAAILPAPLRNFIIGKLYAQ